MPARLSIKSITFSGGERVQLEPGSVLLVVGPNNVGKSRMLADLGTHLPAPNANPQRAVVQSIEWEQEGTGSEFIEWLARWHVTAGEGADRVVLAFNQRLGADNLAAHWESGNIIQHLAGFSVQGSVPCGRVGTVSPPQALDLSNPHPQSPLHELYLDEKKLAEVSKHFERAFGTGLTMPRAGNLLPLLLGSDPLFQDGEDRGSPSFARRLIQQPQLHLQGDGMRAFVAAYLQVLYGSAFIQWLDEADAFLHPPQARLLGELLIAEKKPERQLIMATHSSDVVRGACAGRQSKVTIVRLTRVGNQNHASVLEPSALRDLWTDPILDFSNILDGLFHERVIVCEADADCRFFAAVLQATSADQSRRPDVLFTWSGGKHRLAKVVRALRSLGVPVRAVADFDVLNDADVLGGLSGAFGQDEKRFEPARNVIAAALTSKSPPIQTTQVRSEIDKILSDVGNNVDRKAADRIREVLRQTSPWSEAKLSGIRAVPGSQAYETASQLLAELKTLGLHVVPVGELERFCPSVSGHGPEWVAEVLEKKKDLAKDPELEDARRFVRDLVA
jgi:hypothetical protein